MEKKWFILIMCVCVALCSVSSVCAQPIEEEEEEMMPYPNPIERTTKGAGRVMQGLQKARTAANVAVETGPGPGGILKSVGVQVKGETQGKVEQATAKVAGLKGKTAFDGVDGESSNSMEDQVSTGQGNAQQWGPDGDEPDGGPIDPVTAGAAQVKGLGQTMIRMPSMASQNAAAMSSGGTSGTGPVNPNAQNVSSGTSSTSPIQTQSADWDPTDVTANQSGGYGGAPNEEASWLQ